MAPRTALLLHLGSRSAAYVRTHALAALRSLAISQGLREVKAPEEADRLWAVGPMSTAPWLALEELGALSPDAESLGELCCALSETLATAVLGALVHSSRTLYLCLGEEGAVVDEYCTEPAFFGEDEQWQRALTGDAALWADVLRMAEPAALRSYLAQSKQDPAMLAMLSSRPNDAAIALTSLFLHPPRSAEEQLRRLGALLSFRPEPAAPPERAAFEALEARGYTLLRLAPARSGRAARAEQPRAR